MRICIFGGTGMLGHTMYKTLAQRFHEITVTLYGSKQNADNYFGNASVIDGLDASRWRDAVARISDLKPEVMINCIGVIKHRVSAFDDAANVIAVNSAFPHAIAQAAAEWGGRFIHVSTDCVFSGKRGDYRESDIPDATDLYGRSKALGEPPYPNCLTLRTSIIGPELTHKHSLLEWLLAQRNTELKGFTRAFFSGVTTRRLSEIVARIITDHRELSGLYHVAGEKISKHDLLVKLNRAFELGNTIHPDDSLVIDRSLDSSRFVNATSIPVPTWDEMIAQIAPTHELQGAVS